MNQLVQRVLEVADAEVGVREIRGTNEGVRVDEYLAAAGRSPGESWCASFVYWDISRVCKEFGTGVPVPRTGYCPDFARFAEEHGVLVDGSGVEPGDIFLVYGVVDGVSRFHHTGIVAGVGNLTVPSMRMNVSVPQGGGQGGTVADRVSQETGVVAGDGWLLTYEGNSNWTGGSNGYEVCGRRRRLKDNLRFFKWSKLAKEPTAVPGGVAGEEIDLVLNGSVASKMILRNGTAFCRAADWGSLMGFKVGWDAEDQRVTFDGQGIPAEVSFLEPGVAWVPIRDLAGDAGLQISWGGNGSVVVSRS